MATDDFKEAMGHFITGATKPDVENHLKDLPRAHFDNEEIDDSHQRLLEERLKVITALNSEDMSGARDLSGQLLHTLQDFYSHTNWVEMNSDLYKGLGTPQRAQWKVAEPEMHTCSNCDKKT